MTYPDPPWKKTEEGSLGRPSRDVDGFWQYALWDPNAKTITEFPSRHQARIEVLDAGSSSTNSHRPATRATSGTTDGDLSLTVEMPLGAAQGELDRLTAAVRSGTLDPAAAFSALVLVCEGLLAEAGRHLARVGQLTVALDEVFAVADEAVSRVTDEMVDDLEGTLRRIKGERAFHG